MTFILSSRAMWKPPPSWSGKPNKNNRHGSSHACFASGASAERHVQHHHHEETRHHAERPRVRVLPEMGFRDQFLDHNVQHRARRRAEQPGHERRQLRCREHDQHAEHRLHDAGQCAVGKRPPARQPFLPERQRDCRALGEVLDADAERERARRGNQPRVAAVLGGARKGQADRHAFRDVVQRDREHEQRRAPERGRQPLGLRRAVVQMGQQAVQREHEQDAEHEPARRRHPADAACGLCFLDGGDEQAPYGRRNHHTCRKAEENALHGVARPAAQEKHHRRAERGHQKGKAGAGCGPNQRLCHGRTPLPEPRAGEKMQYVIGNTLLYSKQLVYANIYYTDTV